MPPNLREWSISCDLLKHSAERGLDGSTRVQKMGGQCMVVFIIIEIVLPIAL